MLELGYRDKVTRGTMEDRRGRFVGSTENVGRGKEGSWCSVAEPGMSLGYWVWGTEGEEKISDSLPAFLAGLACGLAGGAYWGWGLSYYDKGWRSQKWKIC